jgi:hypothetical protein
VWQLGIGSIDALVLHLKHICFNPAMLETSSCFDQFFAQLKRSCITMGDHRAANA